jgi:phage regulator Rha-like protein
MNTLKFNSVEEKIISIRGISVILDSDVAELYGVETREINQAVKNNPEKFPEGYILEITKNEHESLRSKILILENQGRGNHAKYLPKAFTEKGLYMLATILKSKRATETTIAIVEAFAKIRELSRLVSQLSETKDEPMQKSLMQKSGEIIADILDNNLEVTDTETSLEINLAVMKFKHIVRQKKK